MTKISCVKLSPTASLPLRMHDSDAAFDLFANESKTISPNNVVAVGTGLALEMPKDVCAFVLSRSGLAVKNKIMVLNAPGLIDSGYRGEIMVILFNAGANEFGVVTGDRIAQLMFQRVESITLREAFEVMDVTDRGTNGLGSTGITLLGDDWGADGVPVGPM